MGNVKCEKVNNEVWANYVARLIFDEWVKGDETLFLEKKKKIEGNSTVRPYIILDNEVPVGCFLIVNDDIKGYPQYNPNLACVCIQKEYRGKGYSNYILKYSIEELKKLDIQYAYLKTDLKGFYEKVGWDPLNEFCKDEMIYRIVLR